MKTENFFYHIGRTLADLRNISGLTQAQFSESVSINKRYYQDLEAGKRNIKLETLKKLCDFHKVNLDEFFKLVTIEQNSHTKTEFHREFNHALWRGLKSYLYTEVAGTHTDSYKRLFTENAEALMYGKKTIIEGLDVSICEMDLTENPVVTWLNPVAEELWGSEVVGTDGAKVVLDAEQLKEVQLSAREVSYGKLQFSYNEMALQKHDGEAGIFSVLIVPVVGGSKSKYKTLCISKEITSQKLAEAEALKLLVNKGSA